MKRAAWALLVLLAAAAAAEDLGTPAEPLPTKAEVSAEEHPRLFAAGWCPVIRSSDNAEETDPGCDVGAGAALVRVKRLAWVAVVGTETVGTGAAWVAHHGQGERAPTIAVAVGIVAPYDDRGIYADRWAVAVGATLSLARR